MALGKSGARIRSFFGNNCQLKFGVSPAWSEIGHLNRWKLHPTLGKKEIELADDTKMAKAGSRAVEIELDLAQSHPEELALLDSLFNSPNIEFWGDAGSVDGDTNEIYAPECSLSYDGDLNSPSADNMKIPIILTLIPQSANVAGVGTDLPTDTIQGDAVAFNGSNEFFADFVASAT